MQFMNIETTCVRKTIKFITFRNFFIFTLFVVPPAHRFADRGFLALRAVGLENPFGVMLQMWLAGSTLVLTGLLGWTFWRRRKAQFSSVAPVSMKTESILVVTWWLLVLVTSAYGFVLGMGG